MSTLEKNLYKRVTVSSGPQRGQVGRAYRGFSSVNQSTEGYALYDFELIKQDIINHFHIRQGEKLSDPSFGTIIWDVLYEPMTENIIQAIAENVTEIINYDPRVNVDRVSVETYESGIIIECEITYLPYNISESMRLKFDEDNGFFS